MNSSDKPAWQERYADKLVSAEQAVGTVHHGQRVFIGSGACVGIAGLSYVRAVLQKPVKSSL